MGKLLPAYKKAMYDELANNIFSNTSQYYAFVANPVAYSNGTPIVTSDDYSAAFLNNWQLIFGKEIKYTDIIPVVNNTAWTTNTVYSMYDNTNANLQYSNFYTIVSPSILGGDYTVFKCISNANGAPSINTPDQLQASSFQKADGYIWRYITSISSANYTKFGTTQYFPIYANTTIQSGAYSYSGVEVVVISNTGSGYISYTSGSILSVVNSTLLQIQSTAATDNDFYTKNGIYIYTPGNATSQLKTVAQYVSNSIGNWVYLDTAANTTNITAPFSQYIISPKVVFDTDSTTQPSAYSVVNTSSNSISSVVIVNTGYGISRANVSIVSNSSYGTGATAYAIVPPSGGHGKNPEIELGMQGYCVSFTFSNTEFSTLPTNIQYNKIGLIKNPYVLNANNTKGLSYSSNTFNSLLIANVSPSTIFTTGSYVRGQTSNSLGIVAFSNSSVVYLTGDKSFSNNETIKSADGLYSANINISSLGNVYTKDMIPLYIQNTNNINRSNTQSESFKLIIQI